MRFCVDEEFIQSYGRWDQQSFLDYLEDNNKPNAWIDHEQLKALCKLFGNKIILIYKKENIGVFPPFIIYNKGVNVTAVTDIQQFIPLLLEGGDHNGHYRPLICNKLLNQDGTYPGLFSSQIRIGATEGEFFRSHYLNNGDLKDPNKTYYEFYRMQSKYETIINFEHKLIADDQKEEQKYIGNDQSDKQDTKLQTLDAALTASYGSKTEIIIHDPLFIPGDQKYIDVIIPLIDSPYYRPKYNYQLCATLKIRIDVSKNLIEKSISTKLSKYYDKKIDFKIKDTFWNKNLFRLNKQIPTSEYVGKQYQINDKYNNINPDSLTIRQKLGHRFGFEIILIKGYIKLEQELNAIIDDNSNLPLRKYAVKIANSTQESEIAKYRPTTQELLDSFFNYFSEKSKKREFNQLLQNPEYNLRNLLSFETWMKLGVYIIYRHYYAFSSTKSGNKLNFNETIDYLKYKLDPDFFMIKSAQYMLDYIRCYKKHAKSFEGLMSKKDASQMQVMISQVIQDARQRFGSAKLKDYGGNTYYFQTYFGDIFGEYYMAMEECYQNAFQSSQFEPVLLDLLEPTTMEMPKLIPEEDDGGDVARKYMKQKDEEIIIEINNDDMIDID